MQAVFAPTEHLYLGGGVFDGSFQEGIRLGSYGPAHFFGKPPDSLSLVGETGLKWGTGTGELPGRLALGAWHDTAAFQRFDGTTQHGASGYYLVLDNTFWRANPKDDNDRAGSRATCSTPTPTRTSPRSGSTSAAASPGPARCPSAPTMRSASAPTMPA